MKTERPEVFLLRYLGGAMWLLAGVGLSAAPLTWFPGKALNEARSGAATVVAPGGSIMIFGGNPIGSTNVLVYGGSDVQQLSATRVAPGAVALGNGRFFVFGGTQTNTARSATSSVLSYNPVATNPDDPSIFNVSPMNTARSELAYAADAAGYAYAIGGLGRSTNALASVERYDPVSDAWTNVAALPVGVFEFGAVFDGVDTIYTFGGRTNATAGAETASVLGYSISNNAWSTLPDMPIATAGSTAIKGADGKYYVIGGTASGVVTNLVQVYDPGSSTWQISTPLPVSLTAAGGAVDALGRLVVIGGADGNGLDLATSWVSQQLNLADVAPAFTSFPPPTANCLVPYSYTAHAGGNPQATYQLLTAPDGMQIDFYSGVVTWTPGTNQFGTNMAAILATNYSGSATQTFAIHAVGPPLAPPTNLVALGVADTSFTLSWEPTVYVIGPLTYQVYLRTFVHSPRGSGGGYVYSLVVGNLTTNSVTFSGLALGSTHTYLVKALAAGVTSSYSAPLTVTLTSPQPPQNLRLTALTSTTTGLAWDPSPGPVAIVSYSVVDYGAGAGVTVEAGVTNSFVALSGLVPGSYHVYEAFAYDAAGHVSSPLGIGAMSLVVWNPLPTAVSLAAPMATASGGLQFTVQAGWVQTTWVQATTNPGDPNSWSTIATNAPSSSAFSFTDLDAGLFPMRFYRAVSQ